MGMRRVLVLVAVAIALVGCGPDEDAISFDGQFFKARVKDLDERHKFVVTASPVSASLLGAREAARYEATKYCVNNYGSSAIRWDVGPDDPDTAMPISNNTLTLQGTCPQ
jgi:hypothetical protein